MSDSGSGIPSIGRVDSLGMILAGTALISYLTFGIVNVGSGSLGDGLPPSAAAAFASVAGLPGVCGDEVVVALLSALGSGNAAIPYVSKSGLLRFLHSLASAVNTPSVL